MVDVVRKPPEKYLMVLIPLLIQHLMKHHHTKVKKINT